MEYLWRNTISSLNLKITLIFLCRYSSDNCALDKLSIVDFLILVRSVNGLTIKALEIALFDMMRDQRLDR